MRVTFYGEVVAKREEQYTAYVFKNLDEQDNSLLRYITVIKLPNWNGLNLDIGDTGYVECEYVDAGDEYYQRNTGTKEQYKYTQCYFLNFIKRTDKNLINQFEF